MNDAIGSRMKDQYEDRTRFLLPRRTYTIVRIDGKAFHTYTRNMQTPFDGGLVASMDVAALSLCKEMQGCVFAYGQSDEYSFLLTDFANEKTDAWFDGNIQKIVSVAASVFTAEFNADRKCYDNLANFDARVFTIPDPTEVENYFIWRQRDCIRNSISAVGQEYFSHRELLGKNSSQVQDLLMEKVNVNWNSYATYLKRGRAIFKVDVSERTEWRVDYDMPEFTKDREYLRSRIPKLT